MLWIDSQEYLCELQELVCREEIDWECIRGKTVLITGGTGLIGSTFINCLLYANKKYNLHLKVIAPVRNKRRAENTFAKQINDVGETLKFIEHEIVDKMAIADSVDFIVHGASPTASRFFVEQPVDTIQTAVFGTDNLLRFAVEKRVKQFVYLSSMEVYGTNNIDTRLDEQYPCTIDLESPRSSYPEAKRLCENLCTAYHSQYGLCVKALRLSQTFGPGVAEDDMRAFAQFGRSAVQGQDIVLVTKGETCRTYTDVMDTVAAILIVMLTDDSNIIFNVANEDTYCSIYEMAQLVAREISKKEISVCINENDTDNVYLPTLKYNLDSTRLMKLGWKPRYGLKEMFKRMVEGWNLNRYKN